MTTDAAANGIDGEYQREQVVAAVRAGWTPQTRYVLDAYLALAPDRVERGQCGPTALVVQDLLGGDLMMGDVEGATDGAVHYWNRLPDGTELDLTAAQFLDGERVVAARAVERPPTMPGPGPARDAYLLLKDRVLAALRDG